MKKINVLISAGGTGGHLIPAQQLAKNLILEGKSSVVFAAKGLSNNRNFSKEIYLHKDISSGPLNRNRFIYSVFAILKGTVQSIFHLLSNKTDVVIGFGSYHTFPTLFAAYLLKKKIVVFESNSYVGKVNRFFAKKAVAITSQFQVKGYNNLQLVPLLPWVKSDKKIDKKLALQKLGLKNDLFTILIFGGSLGASFINDVFSKSAKELIKTVEFQVIHICGTEDEKNKRDALYKKEGVISYVSVYEKDMNLIYPAADLVICRAGASTISELIFFDIPSLLIPLPSASENHQVINALFMRDEVGASKVFFQNDFNLADFIKMIKQFIDCPQNKQMEMKDKLCDFKTFIKNENRKSINEIIYEAIKQS